MEGALGLEGFLIDGARCEAGGIEVDVSFATKPELARRLLEQAVADKVPFGWLTGDSIYGGNRRLRRWLAAQNLPFVLAIAKNEPVWSEFQQQRADKRLATAEWRRWRERPSLVRLGFGASPSDAANSPDSTRPTCPAQSQRWRIGLLCRVCPVQTPLQSLVNVAGQRL
ncbi:MAG: transposase [Chloroflexota bacterium]